MGDAVADQIDASAERLGVQQRVNDRPIEVVDCREKLVGSRGVEEFVVQPAFLRCQDCPKAGTDLRTFGQLLDVLRPRADVGAQQRSEG
jgi:hypothetical protein